MADYILICMNDPDDPVVAGTEYGMPYLENGHKVSDLECSECRIEIDYGEDDDTHRFIPVKRIIDVESENALLRQLLSPFADEWIQRKSGNPGRWNARFSSADLRRAHGDRSWPRVVVSCCVWNATVFWALSRRS